MRLCLDRKLGGKIDMGMAGLGRREGGYYLKG